VKITGVDIFVVGKAWPNLTIARVRTDEGLEGLGEEHFNDLAEEHVQQVAPDNSGVRDGFFDLPSGPRLGVMLDEEVAWTHPKRDMHFDLFAENWHFRQALREGGV
jgi:L-alanine-DL-glutamate epimerase-like enolase superfamily enzyme